MHPHDAGYAQRTRDSFARQAAMATLGATLESVEPGRVVLAMAHQASLTQQHGFFHGGLLGTLLPLFRSGLGGKLGDGKQYMPWVHLDDELGIIVAALTNDTFTGPVNAVAPGIVTNLEFTRTLGRAVHRPTIVPAPAFGLKLVFGEAASAMLGGQRAAPKRTQALGYKFKFPELAGALGDLLG